MTSGVQRAVDVSVVIPTRDRAALLQRALACALAQSDVALEVVVVDDCSVDAVADNPAVADIALADPRVRVIRHSEPEGVCAARNSGVSAAAGDWVAFLDDDDIWAPHKLASQLAAIGASTGCLWSFTGEATLDVDLLLLHAKKAASADQIHERLLQRNVVPGGGSGVVASTELVRSLGGFDESFSILADWEFWIRLARNSRPAVVPDPLVGYVRHTGGMSFDIPRSKREFAQLERKYRRTRADLGVKIDRGSYATYLAELQLRAGDRWQAAQSRTRAAWEWRSRYLRAIKTIISGDVSSLRNRRSSQHDDPEFLVALEAWLDEVRSVQDSSG